MVSIHPHAIRLAVALSVLTPSAAFAELKSQMDAYVVSVDNKGIEQIAPTTSVKPGQIIEYRIVHTNTFDDSISGVTVVGPVPEGLELVPEHNSSDVPAIFEVRGEFDPDNAGEEWSTLPATRVVVSADGSRKIEEAKPEHFTAVRWRLSAPLQENAEARNAYRVQMK